MFYTKVGTVCSTQPMQKHQHGYSSISSFTPPTTTPVSSSSAIASPKAGANFFFFFIYKLYTVLQIICFFRWIGYHPIEDCFPCCRHVLPQLLKICKNSKVWREACECGSCICFVSRILDSSCISRIVGNTVEEVRCLQFIHWVQHSCQIVKVKAQ